MATQAEYEKERQRIEVTVKNLNPHAKVTFNPDKAPEFIRYYIKNHAGVSLIADSYDHDTITIQSLTPVQLKSLVISLARGLL